MVVADDSAGDVWADQSDKADHAEESHDYRGEHRSDDHSGNPHSFDPYTQPLRGFIAGVTIVFRIIALAIVESLARPSLGELSKLLGALAFGIGLPFLIPGRAELFSENLFDPLAAAFKSKVRGRRGRSSASGCSP